VFPKGERYEERDGATICIKTGTTSELNLADYFRSNGMEFDPVPVESDSGMNVYNSRVKLMVR